MQQLCCLSFRKLYDQSRPTLGSKSCGFLKGKKKKARKKGREKGELGLHFQGRPVLSAQGLAHTDTRAETTDKWRCRDSQGQLLSPHPTCQEGEKTARGKKKAARPSGQDRLWVRGAFGSRSCSTPPLCTAQPGEGERGLGGKVFHLGNCPGTHTSDCLLNPLHSISMSHDWIAQ